MRLEYLKDGEICAKESWQALWLANEMFHQCQEVEVSQWLLHTCTLWGMYWIKKVVDINIILSKFAIY